MIRRTTFALFGAVGALFSILFLVLPLVGLLWRAIDTQAWMGLDVSVVIDAIRLSAISTLGTLILTVVFGTPFAYALAKWRVPFKRWINALVELPIVLPPAVAGLALLSVFGRRGMLGGVLDVEIVYTLAAVILAQTFVAAPFYIRAAILGFAAIPPEVEDAARVDGADAGALFWWVLLPLAAPAMGAGLVLSWARALGEFGATLMFAGSLRGTTQTMPTLIYETFQSDINAAIVAALILVGIAALALVFSSWLNRRSLIIP